MNHPTLLIHLECGEADRGLLAVAGALAQALGAHALGIAARTPLQQPYYGDGLISGGFPTELYESARKEGERELAEGQALFRSALEGRARSVEWRSEGLVSSISAYVVAEARGADLILTSGAAEHLLGSNRRAALDDLVLQAGRPVVVVPASVQTLAWERVLVAWKDRREARRAVLDALPLLSRAKQVTVLELAPGDGLPAARARVGEVSRWLRQHDIAAEPLALLSSGDDALRIGAIAKEQDAGLIVAGAYGHSRLREWVLGGVTRELLQPNGRCSQLSH